MTLPIPVPLDSNARLDAAKATLEGRLVAATGAMFTPIKREIDGYIKRARGKVTPATKATVLLVGAPPTKGRTVYEAAITAARARGATIIDRDLAEVLGAPPIATRLTERLQRYGSGDDRSHFVKYWHVGPPTTPAEIEKVEARIGMRLDRTLRSLYLQANGLTLGYRQFLFDAPPMMTLVPGPYTRDLFLEVQPSHALWDGEPGTVDAYTLNIPPLEELFSSHRLVELLNDKEPVRLGKKVCPAGELRNRLFLFDAHHAYTPVFLYLDREAGTMDVIQGGDYGVSLDDYPAVSVSDYLDSLASSSLMSVRFGTHSLQRGTRS